MLLENKYIVKPTAAMTRKYDCGQRAAVLESGKYKAVSNKKKKQDAGREGARPVVFSLGVSQWIS